MGTRSRCRPRAECAISRSSRWPFPARSSWSNHTTTSEYSTAPRVWVLSDGRPGHDHQGLGVAEALGWSFIVKRVSRGRLAALPNRLLGRTRSGLRRRERRALSPPWPDLVIGAGRRTVPPARWIKHQNPSTRLVQLMWPGSRRNIDLVVVPEHDRVREQPGVMQVIGSPHRVTKQRLRDAAECFVPKLARLPRPYIVCLVGGPRRQLPFAPNDAGALAGRLNRMAQAFGGSLLVVTSRRTGPSCEQSLAQSLDVPHLMHRFGQGEDHYLGILGSADAVVVTADSASMCCEACTVGCPVFIDRLSDAGPTKLGRLHMRLVQLGYAAPLGAPWPKKQPPPLNPSATVAEAIRNLMESKP
ncbi:MAG: mitochondrial fission ELM1 family protein [Pseudomonadota bacterium]